MVLLIAACEVGFWLLVVAGLLARYPLRAPAVGAVLLSAVPLVDLVLLVATAAHLRAGAQASWAHGLAAVYLGFTLAYGRRLVAWADLRFAHRFAGGPAPVALYRWDYARRCWADVLRTTAGALVATALLLGVRAWIDDPSRTAALEQFHPLLGVVVAVEVLWAVGYTVWPRSAPGGGPVTAGGRGRE